MLCRTRRAFRVASSAVPQSGWGSASIPSDASSLCAVAKSVRAVLIRRKTGARPCMRARIGSVSSPSESAICGQSQSGQSSRTALDASSRLHVVRVSHSLRASGAYLLPVNTSPGSVPDLRRWPIIRPRPSSAPLIQASERRHLRASKTRSRIAARSWEPAKRFLRAQRLKQTSEAAPSRIASRISTAAATCASGVMPKSSVLDQTARFPCRSRHTCSAQFPIR